MTTTVTVSASTAVVTASTTEAVISVSGNDAAVISTGGAQGPKGDTGPAFEPAEVSFSVVGGTIAGTQPTFSGAPLFAGSYVLMGDVVTFRINVEFDNITNFGTGQYFVELPFVAKYGTMMRDGCLHRASNGNQYAINGHVLPGSKVLSLWYTSGTGQDEAFDHNSPYTSQVADLFHISGTYMKDGS